MNQMGKIGTAGALLAEVRGVAFDYASKPVFRHLDLAFKAGEIVGLIGSNGAGKTTLLRLLMGLLVPRRGTILLSGRALPEYRRIELAQLLSLVPQDTQIGYAFTVREIVAMGRNPYLGRFRPPSAQDEAFIDAAMRDTCVSALADRTIDTLSGGERQRVLIARTMAQRTAIVLLDEATANLDLCHQIEVMELARALTRRGCLVIAAIHDLAMASRFCDRLVLLSAGTVASDGAPTEVLTEDNLRIHFALRARVRPDPDLPGALGITPLGPGG